MADILNEQNRTFTIWGSVDVKDRQGQRLPLDDFKNLMPIWMKRKAPIIFNHTNKVVGEGLNYEFATKDTPEGPRDGVLITGRVFDDYALDDMVWDQLKTGEIEGLSIGARGSAPRVEMDDNGQPEEIIDVAEIFEFSLVDRPANQEATPTFVNAVAKADGRLAEVIKSCPREINEYNKGNIADALKEWIAQGLKLLELQTQKTDGLTNTRYDDATKNSRRKSTEPEVVNKTEPKGEMMKNVKKQEEMVEEPQVEEKALDAEAVMEAVASLAQKVQELESKMSSASEVQESYDEDEEMEKAEGEGEEVKVPTGGDENPAEDVVPGGEAAPQPADEVSIIEKGLAAINKRLDSMESKFKKFNVSKAARPLAGNVKKQAPKAAFNALDVARGKQDPSFGDIAKAQAEAEENELKDVLNY